MKDKPNTVASPKHRLEELIREAVQKYLDAGGPPEFYIISKADHDRNWKQAIASEVKEARIDELKEMVLPIVTTGQVQSMSRGQIISWFEDRIKRIQDKP